jgi:hypothetical protein
MATVPGEADNNVTPLTGMVGTNMAALPKALQPTMADIIMATAVASQRNPEAFRVAGDVVPFQRAPLDLSGNDKQLDEYKKMMTRDTLSRALGGTSNVLPMEPKGKLSLSDGEQKVAANVPIRSQKSLQQAIESADSDEELEDIVKRLKKRGLAIPPQLGPGTLEQK